MESRLIQKCWIENEVSQTSVEFCSICSYHIMNRCLYCRKNRNFSEKCGISWGNCGHAFHTHCLRKAQNKSKVCPLDNKKWINDKSNFLVMKI